MHLILNHTGISVGNTVHLKYIILSVRKRNRLCRYIGSVRNRAISCLECAQTYCHRKYEITVPFRGISRCWKSGDLYEVMSRMKNDFFLESNQILLTKLYMQNIKRSGVSSTWYHCKKGYQNEADRKFQHQQLGGSFIISALLKMLREGHTFLWQWSLK